MRPDQNQFISDWPSQRGTNIFNKERPTNGSGRDSYANPRRSSKYINKENNHLDEVKENDR